MTNIVPTLSKMSLKVINFEKTLLLVPYLPRLWKN